MSENTKRPALREVSVAVENLEDVDLDWLLGEPYGPYTHADPPLQARYKQYRLGDVWLTFLEPTDPKGALGRFIERKGTGLFSVSLESDDIADLADRAKNAGIGPLADEAFTLNGHQARGLSFEPMLMNFLRPGPKSGNVLIELQEPRRSTPLG